jgi:hypothetical protein
MNLLFSRALQQIRIKKKRNEEENFAKFGRGKCPNKILCVSGNCFIRRNRKTEVKGATMHKRLKRA